MQLSTYFGDFLAAIRLQGTHIDDLKVGHTTLRDRLLNDEELAPNIVSTFLQGSYRRATAIRPRSGKRSDVDVVVVTRLSMDEYPDPDEALDRFDTFLDKWYADKYERQGRSIGIELSYVDLDLVITAAPSESEEGIFKAESVTTEEDIEEARGWRLTKSWLPEDRRPPSRWGTLRATEEAEWKTDPLYIPNRDAQCWEPTHPLEQIQWTRDKNARCNGHYVNVVKALKWWRRINHQTPKYPKGYPVEHLIGQSCPDGINSVAEGVTKTLEGIARTYTLEVALREVPNLPDHGVPEHNVLGRVSGDEFAEFHEQVCEAADVAREAYNEDDLRESVQLWQRLFGDKFPDAPPDNDRGGNDRGGPTIGGFTAREDVSRIGGGRFGR